VADVSRQYAVGSKQAAAAATELNTLAGDLRASIAQFKTGGDEAGARAIPVAPVGSVAPMPDEFVAKEAWDEPELAASDLS
jgi:hypothetical protein